MVQYRAGSRVSDYSRGGGGGGVGWGLRGCVEIHIHMITFILEPSESLAHILTLFLHYLQLASHELATIWHKCD